jgi:6-phosphogluconolactonase
MKARNSSALYRFFTVIAVSVTIFVSGCASGHKEFAYAIGAGTNEVFEFRAERDGVLTPLGTPNFAVGSNPTGMAVFLPGDFLYVADFSGSEVTLLDINHDNGLLSTPVSSSVVVPINPPNIFFTGTGPIAVGISPTAPFLYTANQTSGDVTAFTLDPGAGGLTQIGTFPIAPVSHPGSMAISPQGNFLFVANPAESSIAVFAIGNNGGLTLAGGATVPLGIGVTPSALAVEHTGRFLYVTDSANNGVLGFAIQTSGSLTPISGSPFTTGAAPSGLAIDQQGALLYVSNNGSNNVSGFVIDASSGALGAVTGSPFATGGVGPSSVAVDSNTSIVYVTDQVSHDVAAFGIIKGGTLQAVTGSPFGVAADATDVITTVP